MGLLRGLAGLVLRAGAVISVLWGIVQLFDGRPAVGVAGIAGAFVLMIAGTALRSRHARRADLTDALYTAGDDMLGYRSHLTRRNGR